MLGQILRLLTTFSITGMPRSRTSCPGAARSLTRQFSRFTHTATEVKDYLQLMRRMDSGALPPWYQMLLASLEPMAASRSGGPPVFLHFDGRACGLKLPTMERWPVSTGYCFYTWLRAEGV